MLVRSWGGKQDSLLREISTLWSYIHSPLFLSNASFSLSFCDTGLVHYLVSVRGSSDYFLSLTLYDSDHVAVATGNGSAGELKVMDPLLWWPYLMNERPGYLYSLKVSCMSLLRILKSACFLGKIWTPAPVNKRIQTDWLTELWFITQISEKAYDKDDCRVCIKTLRWQLCNQSSMHFSCATQ